jgi:hypothetical protein
MAQFDIYLNPNGDDGFAYVLVVQSDLGPLELSVVMPLIRADLVDPSAGCPPETSTIRSAISPSSVARSSAPSSC